MPKAKSKTPQHVAIICDGNRRWARAHALEVFKGHEYAVDKVIEPLVDQAIEHGVKYLTFWVFSTENWTRAEKEVQGLMNLFRDFFDDQIERLGEKGARIKMIGDPSRLPEDIQQRIKDGEAKTKDNSTITVTMAMNYGGRDELLRAVKDLASQVKTGQLDPNSITRETISEHLDTKDIPDPDFIIRTSGEQRLSGFMLWQAEYAEYYFPEFHFPEFTPERFDEAMEEYASRQRRFGGK